MAISQVPSEIKKSLMQRLTGRAQTSVKQKMEAGNTPENGGTDAGVVEEATSLLAADPPTGQWILLAFIILAVGTVVSYLIWRLVKPADFMPSSNYAAYAGLFIMALAIERILEPFSGLFVPSTKANKVRSRATTARAKRVQAAATGSQAPHAAGAVAVARVPQTEAAAPAAAAPGAVALEAVALEAAAPAAAPGAVTPGAAAKQAAVAQAAFHRSQGARAVLMWATASVLAMVACATLGIFLLRSVETPGSAKATAASSASSPVKGPNRVLDLLVTGLVVGAGTKPLHDLITQIQTSSGSSKASASSTKTG